MNPVPGPKTIDFAEVNGIRLYYEIYGTGKPLLFLHGYTQSSKAWEEFVGEYSDNYRVILVDLRGHGKSGTFSENFSVKRSAEDVLALLKHLGIESTKAIGMSFGGDVLLQMSSMETDVLESMVVIGSNGDWDARNYPEMLESFSFDNIGEFDWIQDFHDGGLEQVKAIIDQLANYKFHLTEDQVRSIGARTLLVLGDRDEQISVESVVRLHRLLTDSRLWIVPGTSHYAHDGGNKSEFLRVSKAFLKE